MTTADPITDPRPWLDPEYVVTVGESNLSNNLAAALGVARATLHRRETLPSGAVVYRAQSTGPVRALCGIADKLNRQHAADQPMPEPPPLEPIPLDELDLAPAADDPTPCGSDVCCQDQDQADPRAVRGHPLPIDPEPLHHDGPCEHPGETCDRWQA